MSKKLTYDEVYEQFKEKGLELLDKEYIRNFTKMKCKDSYGYLYTISQNSLYNGRTPEPFNKFNPYTLQNIQNYLDKESNGSKLITKEYTSNRMTIEITCEDCGDNIIKTWNGFKRNKIFKCAKCQDNPRKYTFDFIKSEFSKKGYTILDTEYIGNNNSLLCIDKDGYKVKKKYTELNYNKNPLRFSIAFNEENYVYNINNYFKINDISCICLKIKNDNYYCETPTLICECECGREFKTNFSAIKNSQVRCLKCSSHMSTLEYKVKTWLDKNNVKYKMQYKFKDCKNIRPLPFDFYLPTFNTCIEVDGLQHFIPSTFSHTKNTDAHKNLEYIQQNDKIKTDYCFNNNIGLLRLDYNDMRRKQNGYKEILSNKFIKN